MTETAIDQSTLIENVKTKATELIEALNQAIDGGVSQAVLLPEMMTLFRESGLSPV